MLSDEIPPATGSAKCTPEIGPIQPKERIEILDVLRGFAIFGILLVTMTGFSGSADADWWTGTTDRLAKGLIFFLGQAKFATIFSFLFGLGFALQLLRVLPPL